MRLVRHLAWPVAAAIWLCYVLFRFPDIAPETVHFRLSPLQAVPFALVLAYGLAVQAALTWRNRHRLRSVLRPTRGRVIGAIALTIVTPFTVVNWFPLVLGVILPNLVIAPKPGLLTVLLIAIAACYPLAANLVSGIPDHIARIGAFALMFWSAYAALILWFGVQAFRI